MFWVEIEILTDDMKVNVLPHGWPHAIIRGADKSASIRSGDTAEM